MLLTIEIIAALIAALRGWGWKPLGILSSSVIFGLIGGALFGYDAINCLSGYDVIVTIILVIMALVGSNSATPEPSKTSYSKTCPYCGENIKREAIFCRYCGKNISENPSQFSSPPLVPEKSIDEFISVPYIKTVANPIESVRPLISSSPLSLPKQKVFGMEIWQVVVLGGMILAMIILVISFVVLIFYMK